MRPKKPKEIKDYRKVPRDLSRHLDSCECIPQENQSEASAISPAIAHSFWCWQKKASLHPTLLPTIIRCLFNCRDTNQLDLQYVQTDKLKLSIFMELANIKSFDERMEEDDPTIEFPELYEIYAQDKDSNK